MVCLGENDGLERDYCSRALGRIKIELLKRLSKQGFDIQVFRPGISEMMLKNEPDSNISL
jgi:hypothetical protein